MSLKEVVRILTLFVLVVVRLSVYVVVYYYAHWSVLLALVWLHVDTTIDRTQREKRETLIFKTVKRMVDVLLALRLKAADDGQTTH